MTTVAVLVDPPRPGTVLTEFVDDGILDPEEASTLYGAMARDVCAAVESSGGELLVNYGTGTGDGDGASDEEAAERAVREAVADGLAKSDAARYEVQVGSSYAARVGNTVTHLLEREAVKSAAVVDPAAALLERRHVDSAAMKLRQSDVVLSPSTDGRVAYAAFREPIDFADAFAPPAIETLTERARDENLSVDVMEMLPVLERPSDVATVVSQFRARQRADKRVPEHTAAAIEALGLRAEADGGALEVVRD